MTANTELMDLLTQLNDGSTTVKNILQQEQLALSERDHTKIMQSSQLKLAASNDLNKTFSKLTQSLSKNGHHQEIPISQFLQQFPQNQSLLELWSQCESTIKQCNEINRTNSTLVSSGIQRTIQALNFLTQSANGESNYRYDKSGIHTGTMSYGMNIKA